MKEDYDADISFEEPTSESTAENVHVKKEEDPSEYCDTSSDDFQSPNDLQAHLISSKPQNRRHRSGTNKKPNKRMKATESSEGTFYPCHYCSKVFRSYSSRSTHKRRVHDECRPHKCDACGRGFYNPSDLHAHVRTHTGEKPHVCQHCGKGFLYPYSLRRHVQIVKCHQKAKEKPSPGEENVVFLENGLKRYKCTECNLVFPRIHGLFRHVEKQHDGEKHECHLCGHSTSTKVNLGKHVRRVHSGLEPNLYRCRFCRKRCFNNRKLRSHLRTHGEDLFICATCFFSTFIENNFVKHGKTHVGIGEGAEPEPGRHDVKVATPFKCHLCFMEFSRARYLTTHHLKRHPKKKPAENKEKKRQNIYKCVECSLCFTSSSSLARHVMVKHKGHKPHECNVCGISTSQKCNLDSHFRKIHLEPKFPCRFCRKPFPNDGVLRSHLKTHGENLYICDTCSYSTFAEENFRKHEKTHGINGEAVSGKSGQLVDMEADYGTLKGGYDKCSSKSASENVSDESAAESCSSVDHDNEREDSSSRLPESERMPKSELVPQEFRALRDERRHRCRLCGKIYAQSYHLELHLRAHREEAFSCELCSYSTDNKSNLEQHEETTHWIMKKGKKVTPPAFRFILDGQKLCAKAVHTGQGVKRHGCKICSSNFCSAEELCVHFIRCHRLPAIILHNLK